MQILFHAKCLEDMVNKEAERSDTECSHNSPNGGGIPNMGKNGGGKGGKGGGMPAALVGGGAAGCGCECEGGEGWAVPWS